MYVSTDILLSIPHKRENWLRSVGNDRFCANFPLSFCEKYVLVTLWNVLNIYSDQTHNKEKPDESGPPLDQRS